VFVVTTLDHLEWPPSPANTAQEARTRCCACTATARRRNRKADEMPLKRSRRVFLTWLVVSMFHLDRSRCIPRSANAQTANGTIVGIVQDSNGSILVSARVTIEPTSRQAATNDQGQFRVSDLPARRLYSHYFLCRVAPSTLSVKVQSGQVATVNQTLEGGVWRRYRDGERGASPGRG